MPQQDKPEPLRRHAITCKKIAHIYPSEYSFGGLLAASEAKKIVSKWLETFEDGECDVWRLDGEWSRENYKNTKK